MNPCSELQGIYKFNTLSQDLYVLPQVIAIARNMFRFRTASGWYGLRALASAMACARPYAATFVGRVTAPANSSRQASTR